MQKITKLRNSGQVNIYVKTTDYELKPISRNEVIVCFHQDFWDYYGTTHFRIRDKFITHKNYPNTEIPNFICDGYNKNRIRDLVRENFKNQIEQYIKEQNPEESNDIEINASDFNFDIEKSEFDSVSLDDFEFEEEKENDMVLEEFEEIKEDVIFEEFVEVKTDDFDFTDDLSHSTTLPAAQVIEYFETLFTTQIEPSNPIVDYITEASAKLKYLTYEAETKQKITDKEKEIQSLKSLLKLNTEIMKKSNDRLKEIKNKLK